MYSSSIVVQGGGGGRGSDCNSLPLCYIIFIIIFFAVLQYFKNILPLICSIQDHMINTKGSSATGDL